MRVNFQCQLGGATSPNHPRRRRRAAEDLWRRDDNWACAKAGTRPPFRRLFLIPHLGEKRDSAWSPGRVELESFGSVTSRTPNTTAAAME